MRVPISTHEAHPWVMSRIAPDFELMDVWALPVEGSSDQLVDFLVTQVRLRHWQLIPSDPSR